MGMGTLFVRNRMQAALFEIELKGQISDGNWENLRVGGHYRAWCDADVVVYPDHVGRDFYVSYDRYNFVDAGLLKVIGERMMVYARLAMGFGFEESVKLARLVDDQGFVDVPKYGGSYYDGVRKYATMVDLEEVGVTARNSAVYDWKHLRKDLRDLKKIVRIQV